MKFRFSSEFIRYNSKSKIVISIANKLQNLNILMRTKQLGNVFLFTEKKT